MGIVGSIAATHFGKPASFLLLCVWALALIPVRAAVNGEPHARPSLNGRPSSPHQSRRSRPRKKYPQAPDVIIGGLDGQNIRLRDRRGAVVLVDFWASWCGPCRRTIPLLNVLEEKYKGRGLEIIGVSMDEGTADDLKAIAQDFRIQYTAAYGDPETEEAFGVRALPTSFLIDRRGRVRAKHFGAVSRNRLEREITALLAE